MRTSFLRSESSALGTLFCMVLLHSVLSLLLTPLLKWNTLTFALNSMIIHLPSLDCLYCNAQAERNPAWVVCNDALANSVNPQRQQGTRVYT